MSKTTGPRYWRVSPRFWAETQNWTSDARTLALYLLTCPHRTTEGLFRLPRGYIADDLGWALERLAQPFAELLDRGFIQYDENASVVLIVKAMKYQAPENPNQITSAVRKLAELPDTFLTSTFKALAEQFCQGLYEALPEGFGEGCGEPPSPAQARTQPPAPVPKTSSTGLESGSPQPVDDDDAMEAALAQARREAEGYDDIANLDGWVRSRAKKLIEQGFAPPRPVPAAVPILDYTRIDPNPYCSNCDGTGLVNDEPCDCTWAKPAAKDTEPNPTANVAGLAEARQARTKPRTA